MAAQAAQCGKCGAPLVAGVAFCGRCGTPVMAAAPAAAPAAPGPPAAPAAPATPAAPAAPAVYCPRCGTANAPGSTFCGRCGTPFGQAVAGGQFALLTPTQLATAVPFKVGPWIWVGAGALVLFLMVVMGALALVAAPKAQPTCPDPCRVPPPGAPALAAQHLYTSKAYGYTLEYPDHLGNPTVSDDHTVGWTFQIQNVRWPASFTGEPAKGRSAQQVVEAVKAGSFADAKAAFQIPGAGLGYNSGYGTTHDATIRVASGQSLPARLLIVASVKKDLAIYLVAVGPIDSKWAAGHANPSATVVGHVTSPLVNGVNFPGDPTK